ncbi:MAG: M23 family metallopeptidase [Bacteroidales bacterium]|nr:M23 family metallopeptidase [Bacteroidales bacterium]
MKDWFKNFKSKFKVVIVHPETYEEKGRFNMSKMKFINLVVIYSLILIAITTCIIFFTSVRELIPGYTDVTLDRRVYNMERRADSIETVFRQEDQYIENLKRIINGEEVDFDIKQMTLSSGQYQTASVSVPTFFVPVNGLVTNHFNRNNKHYGVDVVGKADAVIKATADGTVVFSDWTVEGGYIVGIQHDCNIISIYKHNATVLCNEGDVVKAGDAIAILGDSGTTSTGPHLHFELWVDGRAVNPEDYISFEGK